MILKICIELKYYFNCKYWLFCYFFEKLVKINFGFNCVVLVRLKKYKVFVYYYVMYRVFVF